VLFIITSAYVGSRNTATTYDGAGARRAIDVHISGEKSCLPARL